MATTDARQVKGWVDRLAVLYSPVVADVLDKMGYRDQSLRADIRPLATGIVTAGVARTVRTVPVTE